MKRILLILLTFSVLLSCDRNLLDATKTPDKINLDDIEGFEYKYIDVKPEVAPDGVVFGNYYNDIVFNGNVYILAEDIFKYNEKNKTKTKIGSNAILRIDGETITIYAKNLPYSKVKEPHFYLNSHDMFANNAWYNLTRNRGKLVIESDIIYNEYSFDHNYKYKVDYSKRTVDSGDLGQFGVDEIDAYWPSSMTVERNGRGKTYTKDLVNWTTEYRYGESWTPINFPSPTFDFDEDDYPHDNNFNGRAGINEAKIIHFKGHIYVLGGYDMGREKIDKLKKKTYNLALKHYYRLDVSKNGAVAGNWEYRGVPFGRRASMLVRINEEEGKMYINDGATLTMTIDPFAAKNDDKVKYDSSRDFIGNIWSTSDGINWNRDSQANWDRALSIDYKNGSRYIGPDPGSAFVKSSTKPTPDPLYPIKIGKTYYTFDLVSIDNNYQNGVPAKISNAILSGITNYTISEQDIKDSDIIQLFSAKVNPHTIPKSQWTRLPSMSPITSILWMGDSYFIANNDKLIRLIDYSSMSSDIIMEYTRNANSYLNKHKLWYERAVSGVYTNEYLPEKSTLICFSNSMENKYYADMYNYYATNMIKHYMPDKAITHYSIDLSNAE